MRPRRLAEKPRVSTCLFADRVARCVLSACRRYGMIAKQGGREEVKEKEMTVIAAFVVVEPKTTFEDEECATFSDTEEFDGNDYAERPNAINISGGRNNVEGAQSKRLRVIAIGKGTKVCSHRVIGSNHDGLKVHDLHAEVLARRALIKVLYREIISGGGRLLEGLSNENGCTKFQWRKDISLHLYVSSAPCGNATLKRWAKSKKEVFIKDLDEWSWPEGCRVINSMNSKAVKEEGNQKNEGNPDDNCFTSFAAWEGQVASLVKRDPDVALISKLERQIDQLDSKGSPQQSNGLNQEAKLSELRDSLFHSPLYILSDVGLKKKLEKLLNNVDIIPPGTSIPGLCEGCVLTCSDKIAIWNCLGYQGALLKRFIPHPIIVDSITIGRKFSQAHMRRAVCCRMIAFDEIMRQRKSHLEKSKGREFESNVGFPKLHHPTLMCTSVMLDYGDVDRDKPAKFDSPICEAWANGDSVPEKIDSTTGMLVSCIPTAKRVSSNFMEDSISVCMASKPSSLCKQQLFELYTRVAQQLNMKVRLIPEDDNCTLSFICIYNNEKRLAGAWHCEARDAIHSTSRRGRISLNPSLQLSPKKKLTLFEPGKGWPRDGFKRKRDYFWSDHQP